MLDISSQDIGICWVH